ncbi:MAG: HAD hydrolase-like protein [Anaerolineae bacterium]
MNQSNGRTYLPDTQIEIISSRRPCAPPRYVLFDFDGTISLIREGWQGIMAGLMLEWLLATPQADDEATLRQLISDLILHSTGRPTIDQMVWLAEEVARRGGQPQTPDEYKNIYLDQLRCCVNERIAALKCGQVAPADLTIPGVLDLLAQLAEHGITCYLASGTERADVVNEVGVLGLTSYFEDRIYGPHHSEPAFSKEMVIQQIIQEHQLHGCELLSFGDGRVEIAHTAEVDGIAIGVASNEVERQGVDELKRAQLIQAGAVIIIPDFRESEFLIEYLFNGNEAMSR